MGSNVSKDVVDLENKVFPNAGMKKESIIVEFGSGNGILASSLEEKYGVTVITLDPDKESKFGLKPGMVRGKDPMYDDVKHFLSENKDKKVDLLIIDWPYPNSGIIGDATFVYDGQRVKLSPDVAAIKMLNPDQLIVRYDEGGAAGSTQLIKWITDCEKKNTSYYIVGGLLSEMRKDDMGFPVRVRCVLLKKR